MVSFFRKAFEISYFSEYISSRAFKNTSKQLSLEITLFQNIGFIQILCIRILFIKIVQNPKDTNFPNIALRSSLLTNVLSVTALKVFFIVS